MTAFWDKDNQKKEEVKPKKNLAMVAVEKKGKKKKSQELSFSQTANIEKTILFPLISEDAMNKQVLGQYVFRISPKANKSEVKKAIFSRYGVSVKRVNILNLPTKKSFFKGKAGLRKRAKKAVVTLEKGQSIEFFSTK